MTQPGLADIFIIYCELNFVYYLCHVFSQQGPLESGGSFGEIHFMAMGQVHKDDCHR